MTIGYIQKKNKEPDYFVAFEIIYEIVSESSQDYFKSEKKV